MRRKVIKVKSAHIRELYEVLFRVLGEQKDADWNFGLEDDAFIYINSWGPWRAERQSQVHQEALRLFRKKGGRLHFLNRSETLEYPLEWQRKFLRNLVIFLHEHETTFFSLVQNLKQLQGTEARTRLNHILGVKTYSKVVSCMIRDIVNAECFPIDRRVRRLLKLSKLPVDEDEIIQLCRKEKINCRELNRMMYLGGGR